MLDEVKASKRPVTSSGVADPLYSIPEMSADEILRHWTRAAAGLSTGLSELMFGRMLKCTAGRIMCGMHAGTHAQATVCCTGKLYLQQQWTAAESQT